MENNSKNENKILQTLDMLNRQRQQYVTDYLGREIGELSQLEKKVLNSLAEKTTITDKIDTEDDTPLTLGQKLADHVATFGGSWTFILSFGGFLCVWIIINVLFLASRAFDPYPFILLNLILSCLAAIQAPIIMMSQNRQEEKDRERAKKDYMINLKSELEIRILHEKIDHFIMQQQHDLLEIQQIQIDIMENILKHVEKK